jgi:hypothetical protein
MKYGRRLLMFAVFAGLSMGIVSRARPQERTTEKKKGIALMKDTLDGRLDFSRFLIDAHGFIPIPLIITEPALGGIGLAVAPIFLTPKKEIPRDMGYVPPDITAAFGMLTANGSWAAGAAQIGSIPKAGIKYRIGGAYVDMNIRYYRELPNEGERAFEFNIRSFPVLGSISKRIARTNLYAGLQYTYAGTKLRANFPGDMPDFIKDKELDNQLGTLGTFLDWDSRNSVFTPDKGIRAQIAFYVDDQWTASDFTYQKLSLLANWFQPIHKKWVSGLRLEGSQVYGDAPFFFTAQRNPPRYSLCPVPGTIRTRGRNRTAFRC